MPRIYWSNRTPAHQPRYTQRGREKAGSDPGKSGDLLAQRVFLRHTRRAGRSRLDSSRGEARRAAPDDRPDRPGQQPIGQFDAAPDEEAAAVGRVAVAAEPRQQTAVREPHAVVPLRVHREGVLFLLGPVVAVDLLLPPGTGPGGCVAPGRRHRQQQPLALLVADGQRQPSAPLAVAGRRVHGQRPALHVKPYDAARQPEPERHLDAGRGLARARVAPPRPPPCPSSPSRVRDHVGEPVRAVVVPLRRLGHAPGRPDARRRAPAPTPPRPAGCRRPDRCRSLARPPSPPRPPASRPRRPPPPALR